MLNRCATCRCYNTRPYCYLKSPNLPSFRLDKSTPFSACGIDYIGPLYTKNVDNNQQEDEHQLFKYYVVLYTCAATRGVVLDIVPDASAKIFINIFQNIYIILYFEEVVLELSCRSMEQHS